MNTYDEYYNIPSFPKKFVEDIEKLNKSLEKKLPGWKDGIILVRDQWPEGNMIHLKHEKLTIQELATIDVKIRALLKKYKLTFETLTPGYVHIDEG